MKQLNLFLLGLFLSISSHGKDVNTIACDLSASSSPVYQSVSFNGPAFFGRESAEQAGVRLALEDCKARFNNESSCKLVHYETSTNDGNSFQTRVVYSFVAPASLSKKQIIFARCEKAYACLASSPSDAVVELIKNIIETNRCR